MFSGPHSDALQTLLGGFVVAGCVPLAVAGCWLFMFPAPARAANNVYEDDCHDGGAQRTTSTGTGEDDTLLVVGINSDPNAKDASTVGHPDLTLAPYACMGYVY